MTDPQPGVEAGPSTENLPSRPTTPHAATATADSTSTAAGEPLAGQATPAECTTAANPDPQHELETEPHPADANPLEPTTASTEATAPHQAAPHNGDPTNQDHEAATTAQDTATAGDEVEVDDDDTSTNPDDDTPTCRSKEGHGSQRVQNKACKYEWKQANRQQRQPRPPPQDQDGPGWGIVYRRTRDRERPAQAEPSQPRQPPKESKPVDWKDLLNRHTLPWGTYGSSRPSADTADASPGTDEPPTQQQQQQPPPTSHTPAAATDHMARGDDNTGDNNTPEEMPPSNANPHSSSSDLEVDRATPEASPAEDHTTSNTAPQSISPDPHSNPATQEATATGSATCTDNTAHTIPAATPDTMPPWEAQLIQEWVDAQTDDPIQYMEIPPDFPIPPNTQGDMQPLTHGRWRIEVVPSPDAPAHAPPARGRLPRSVRQGAEGTANTAPPFTTGLVGIFSQMTTEHWLLDIQQAPPPEQHEPGTMLLTAGDKLLFERVDGEWIIRVEHLNPDAPEEVRRLRESNTPTPSPTKPSTAKDNRGRSILPSIPEHDDPPAQSNSGASSSHEVTQSYYPANHTPRRPGP